MPADRDECIVTAHFARELERELAAANAALAEARRMISEINDENERLSAELAAMEKQRDEARDTAAAIHKRNWYEAKTEYGTALGKVRAELAAERATTASLLRIIALIREAGGFTREDLDALPGAVKAMRQQRDEAQEGLCRLIALRRKDRGLDSDPETVAAERGWDCFAKKQGGGA